MKICVLPWHYFAVLSLLFFSVHCLLDQKYEYQNAHPSKKKLPLEMMDESYVHSRYKRDANSNENVMDDHKYYTSSYFPNKESDWTELSNHPEKKNDQYLSNGYLKSKNFKLKFTFPYYGHPVTNATVTTGGFLYVGYVETSLITSVMYIAPFMAPFNPSINESAAIYYLSNATQFTVQWTNLHLYYNEKAGPFTFQCTLYKDGRIHFAYKSLPLSPQQVQKQNSLKKHPVRVGISDAFYGYRMFYQHNSWFKVRIFYVYHRVNKINQITSNGSLLLLNPVKNCIAAKSCGECVNLTIVSVFNCTWCSKLQRCSDAFDRHRMEWFQKCNKIAIKEYKKCHSGNKGHKAVTGSDEKKSGLSIGAAVGIFIGCLVLVLVLALGSWCFYAYTHPVSPSGLYLIEFRNKPAQLFKRSGNGSSGAAVGGATTSASKA